MAEQSRWEDIDRILVHKGPFATPSFKPNLNLRQEKLKNCPILVIGAGGLGCELLKDLALTGFTDIHVIDMDTIDVSNLNRQFLFRQGDVGKPKAVVAADFVNRRVPGVKVVPYHCAIQTLPPSFYRKFKLVVSGLDSITARRWLNETLVGLVTKMKDENGDDTDNWEIDSLIPLVDGGTEGWMGQSRVIFPHFTPCFECLLHLFPADPLNFQECTVAVTPRQPEHCIVYAMWFAWKEDSTRKDTKIDGDDPDHVQWLFDKAVQRAKEFGIEGVTYKLTQGVVKKIIPAIASTNAIIAASCANEAYKIATYSVPCLDNWMMYNGGDNVYTHTMAHEINAECLVCSTKVSNVFVAPDSTLQDFINFLINDKNQFAEITNPSISKVDNGKSVLLHMPNIVQVNLAKKMSELVEENQQLAITNKGKALSVTVKWKHN